jgi:hypothetical protein
MFFFPYNGTDHFCPQAAHVHFGKPQLLGASGHHRGKEPGNHIFAYPYPFLPAQNSEASEGKEHIYPAAHRSGGVGHDKRGYGPVEVA